MDEASVYAAQVLNGLIETTVDSANGYEKAASLARNPRFSELFHKRADERRGLAKTLAGAVRGVGGEAVQHGSALGPAHRLLVGLRDKAGKDSDKPLIEEVERGEDFLCGRFEQARADGALPAQARETIAQACGQIKTQHDEIAALKQQFQ